MSSVAVESVNPDADGLVGGIDLWPSQTLPGPKYRFADGSLLVRTEFSLLYSRIGTQFNIGGETSSQFRLPNAKGRTFVCVDPAQTEFDLVGETGGTKAASMPTHGHAMSGAPGGTFGSSGHTHTGLSDAPSTATDVESAAPTATVSGNSHTHNTTTGGPSATASPTIGTLAAAEATGSGNNMPPYLTLQAIIKVS